MSGKHFKIKISQSYEKMILMLLQLFPLTHADLVLCIDKVLISVGVV